MEDLIKIREKIDSIDDEIVKEYIERINLCGMVAEEKKKMGKAVSDLERERKILYRITENVPEKYHTLLKELYSTIFATSKAYQSSLIGSASKTKSAIDKIIEGGLTDLPERAAVACQGVKGANSGTAAEKLFPISDLNYFKTFEGVFSAVESGLCDYGVLPIENSTAGSVLDVYDLMKKYDFHIVRTVRIKIEHCLAAIPGATLSGIKKVVSHPQAISQCSEYIKVHKLDSELGENTAIAAKNVSEQEDKTVAAICSPDCAALYGLQTVERAVQNNVNNFTRFICIGKNLEIFKGSDKISVMTALSHRPGSLNEMLMKFSTLGLNLTKIESRPIVGTDFEFMFYFDFEGDITRPDVLNLIAELENSSDKFVFLGSYKEII